ncbi:MAG: GNAT family N-acetyltransferase [Spirochaetaceae bacterium]|jgi:GNAT superfamily N-acetyltransferase|nr:GNAT family N-acetyltransferase [Spirochaetaceae bacterium]
MIRPYKKSDLEDCMTLWKIFDDTHLSQSAYYFKEPTQKEREIRHGKYTGESNKMFLVCQEKDRIVGFVLGELRLIPDVALLKRRYIMEIHGIAILESWRNSKTAGQLIQGALDFGKEKGAQDVEGHLWSFNHRVEELINGFGFTLQSKKYGYRIDG